MQLQDSAGPKAVEQLSEQLSATGIQAPSAEASATQASGQAHSHPQQAVHDKDRWQKQAELLSEQLEAANRKLMQAENTASDLKAAMRDKLTVSDQRQIQIESRVAELQQQLELHSVPAQEERTALRNKCELLQAENKELKQQVDSLQQQLSKVQAGSQSAQAV